MFSAAAAVTVKALSDVDAEPLELALPREVESEPVLITKVVTLSSSKSSFNAATILSSVSSKTTSPE